MRLRFLILGMAAIMSTIPSKSQDWASSLRLHKQMEGESVFEQLPWTSLGPSFQGGRVETIASPPNQPEIIYAGFGSGGLWKTENSGLSWKLIFTEETYSIGDLAISTSNPNILYLGTGEALRASQGYSYPGTGMYKSTDAGNSWEHLGLDDSHHIGRVVVDPTNPDLVFVAVIGHFWSPNPQRGLYMSTDGGKHWERSLYVSDSVGVVDVAWDFVNGILIATTWDIPAGNKSGLYRSADMGKTWIQIVEGLPQNQNVGRMGVCFSPSHPNTVYLIADHRIPRDSADASADLVGAELFRSNDGGLTWKKTHEDFIDNYSGFGWAFGDVVVSPVNKDEVFILGVHLLRSKNGGITFNRVSGNISHVLASDASTLHLDQHHMLINPQHPEQWTLGNDGGVYLTHNAGNDWLHLNNIPVGEFYDLSLQEHQGMLHAYGGTQDNASVTGIISRDAKENQNQKWSYVWLDPWSGGDGFSTYSDPGNPERVYWESQNGYVNIKNLATGESTPTRPVPDKDEGALRTHWFTPFFVSLHESSSLYYGGNKVYKSLNSGEGWMRISPDLTYSEDPLKKSRALVAIAESPKEAGILFAGTEKGALWVSRDDGMNWTEVSTGLPAKKISCITPSAYNSQKVFVTLKGMDDDDYSAYVYVSNNLGKDWTAIHQGLPSESVNYVLEDPVFEALLYVATDRGIYVSANMGDNWTAISTQLPTASVQKVLMDPDHRYLIAVTHGLSLFKAYIEPVRDYFRLVDPRKLHIIGCESGEIPEQGDFQGTYRIGTLNAIRIYWYQPNDGEIDLAIEDVNEKKIYEKRIEGYTGMNFAEWDLIVSTEEDESLYPIRKYKFPETGPCKVKVRFQGTVKEVKSEIR